ncbi:MAG: cell division protein FtsL [Mariprofundaceae bacterium]
MILSRFCKPWQLITLVVIMLAVAQVALSHARNAMAKEINLLRDEQYKLVTEVNRLQLERTSLTRPERLREIAHQRLGMAPPLASQVLRP